MKKLNISGLRVSGFFLLAVCAGFLFMTGAVTAGDTGGKTPEATLQVCPTAKVTTVECFMKESKFSGGQKLHMKIGVKNISDQPRRYRVSIFLPNGASSGGFYPRKGKPPVLKPGEDLVLTFPMYYDSIPDAYTIKVDEL